MLTWLSPDHGSARSCVASPGKAKPSAPVPGVLPGGRGTQVYRAVDVKLVVVAAGREAVDVNRQARPVVEDDVTVGGESASRGADAGAHDALIVRRQGANGAVARERGGGDRNVP